MPKRREVIEQTRWGNGIKASTFHTTEWKPEFFTQKIKASECLELEVPKKGLFAQQESARTYRHHPLAVFNGLVHRVIYTSRPYGRTFCRIRRHEWRWQLHFDYNSHHFGHTLRICVNEHCSPIMVVRLKQIHLKIKFIHHYDSAV